MTHRYLDFSQSKERKLLAELFETLPIVETDEDPLEEIQRWVEVYRADRRKELFSRLLNAYGWKRYPINVFGKMEVFIGTQEEFDALKQEYERDGISKQIAEQTPVTLSLLELTEKMARMLFEEESEVVAKVALALHGTVTDDRTELAMMKYAESLFGCSIIKNDDTFLLEKK